MTNKFAIKPVVKPVKIEKITTYGKKEKILKEDNIRLATVICKQLCSREEIQLDKKMAFFNFFIRKIEFIVAIILAGREYKIIIGFPINKGINTAFIRLINKVCQDFKKNIETIIIILAKPNLIKGTKGMGEGSIASTKPMIKVILEKMPVLTTSFSLLL